MTPAVAVPQCQPGLGPLIPAPAVVRDRLYRLRAEARLLARLLRLSEDHLRSLPAPTADAPPEPKGVARD